MAGKILKTTDFVGKYAISQNQFNTSNLQSFIDKYELLYLYDLLGIDLATAFYADITTPFSAPVTPKYATIFNPLAIDESTFCNRQLRSEGVKDMLLGFVYWEFVRKQKVKTSLNGPIIQSGETTREADWAETGIYANYNDSVRSYNAIQSYVIKKSVDYTEYNGISKTIVNNFL